MGHLVGCPVSRAAIGGNGFSPAVNFALLDGCENVARPDDKWTIEGHSTAPVGSIPGMNGLCYDDALFAGHTIAVVETGEFTASWKIRFRSLPVASQVFALFFNAGANQPFALNLLPTGAIEATKSSGNDTSVASLIAIDTTYIFEFYGKVHPTDGAYRLKIDGVVPAKSGGGTMEASGTDTSTGTPDTIIRWRVGNGTTDTYVDDHAFDSAGGEIGTGQVETRYPDGAGDLAELTRAGTDSGANWSQCDEAVGNGNTDYVVTTVNGATFKNQLRIGGVNYDGAITHTAISGFDCYMEVWNLNPATGLPWTDSDIDGLQAGIFCIDANQRDVYTFQNRSVSGTPRAVQVTTYVSLSASRIRMTQVVLEVWVET